MSKKLFHIGTFCVLLLSFSAQAQNTQYWLDYYQYRLLTNDNWKLSHRASIQYNPSDNYDFTFAYRPDVAHKVGLHGRFIAGNGFFYYQDNNNTLELRPWIGFQRNPSRLNSISLTHFVRWENRLFFGERNNIYESRFRYKVTAEADIFRYEGKAMSIIFAPEMFLSVGSFDNFYYNRIRYTIGTRYQWGPFWQTDLSVIRQTNKAETSSIEDNFDWIIQLKFKRLLLKN